MTPHRLRAKQLAHTHVRVGYDVLVDNGEFAALYVWERVIELAADSADAGVLLADSRPAARIGLVNLVARHGRVSDRQAEAALHTLAEFGLVERGEDGIALAIVPRAPRGGLRDPGGRPRGDETREQARERRLAEQAQKAAAKRAQGNMLWPIQGGKAAAAAGNPPPKTSNSEVRFSGEVSGEVSEAVLGRETGVPGSGVSSRLAAAVVEESGDSTLYQQQQQQRVPDSRAGETGNLAAEVFAGETGNLETGVLHEEVSVRAVSREAEAIAAEAVRALGLGGSHAARAAAFVQGWLDEGASPDDVRDELRRGADRDPGDEPIRSLRWFRKAVRERIAERQVRAVPGPLAAPDSGATAGEAPPRARHPAIAANPLWAQQPIEVAMWLEIALRALDLPAGSQHRGSKLRWVNQKSEAAWRLLVAARPEAWEIAELPPPEEAPRAAAG